MSEQPRPRVTICVPTIGRVRFLPATAESISRQTRRDFEVLILDNACEAEASGLLKAWAGRDDRVRILRADPRVPMFANFNRGVHAAKGDYIAFCHDDDCLRPQYLERHVAFMDAHPDVAFTGSNYNVIDETGATVDRSHLLRRDGTWRGHDHILNLMRSEYTPLKMQTIFFRASVLKKGGFDEEISPYFGDFVVLMRIAEDHAVGYIAEALVEVRQHSGQESRTLPKSEAETYRDRLLGAYCDEYAARWPNEVERIAALRAARRTTRRLALLRGWLAAPSSEEGQACLAALDRTLLDRTLSTALQGVERLGMPPERRQSVVRAIRRIKLKIRSAQANLE